MQDRPVSFRSLFDVLLEPADISRDAGQIRACRRCNAIILRTTRPAPERHRGRLRAPGCGNVVRGLAPRPGWAFVLARCIRPLTAGR